MRRRRSESEPFAQNGPGDGVSAARNPARTAGEFEAAVREALRHFHRPDLLISNPLLRSRLVETVRNGAASALPSTQALRQVLRDRCAELGDAPQVSTLKRTLELTYFRPLRSQQAAAEALGVSWSTYRRRLAAAIRLLTVQLWEAERALAVASGGEIGGPAEDSGATIRQPGTGGTAGLRRGHRLWILVTVLLVVAGIGVWRFVVLRSSKEGAAAASGEAPVTLGVLPFADLGRDPARRYLSDGITEELINRLGRIPQLRVAARNSAFVFRGKPVDVRTAARALGVEYVLEGSIEESGSALRVHVALVNARDGYQIWTDEYMASATDLLSAEDAIATDVIEGLPLDRAVAKSAKKWRATEAPGGKAQDFYLVGLEYLNRRTGRDIEQAIDYFKRANRADPDFAPAWGSLATSYAVLRDYESDEPPDSRYADALSAARRAVTLDPGLDKPHAVLGLLEEEHWQWAAARRELQLALRLDPSDPTAHQWYAMYLWFDGDTAGALAEMRTAHDLDPLSPIINADLCRALLYAGKPQAAISQCNTAIALEPRFALAHLFLAEAYMSQARNADAFRETRTAISLTPAPHPASYLSMLGLAYMLTGDEADARSELETLQRRAQRHYVSGVSLAVLYWALGEKDQAFSELDRAVADHDHLMMPVIADRKAPWTTDPRFKTVIAGMHLPVAPSEASKP